MPDVKNQTAKRRILEYLDSFSWPIDEDALLTAVRINEKEMRQIVKSINNEQYTYEKSLVGMGLVRENKKPFGESKYSITDKGRLVLRYIWRTQLEEML